VFQNPEIAIETLPGVEKLDWQGMHPNYKRRLLVQHTLVVLVVGIVVSAAIFILSIPVLIASIFWVALLISAILLLVWPLISVPRRGYVVRDKDILFRSGVVWQSITAIPFNRIQHVETSNTPLDRRFEIATLQLFTAGGSGGDLKIDGLGIRVAEQMRIFILERVKSSIENT